MATKLNNEIYKYKQFHIRFHSHRAIFCNFSLYKNCINKTVKLTIQTSWCILNS